MEDETENKLNEGFISRWSKKKSNNKSDIKVLTEKENVNKMTNLENDGEALVSSEIADESEYDELNDEELLEKFNLPNPENIKKEKGLDLFFKDGTIFPLLGSFEIPNPFPSLGLIVFIFIDPSGWMKTVSETSNSPIEFSNSPIFIAVFM